MKNYVKEYKGHKVPEGATHFTEESDKEYFCFYRLHGSEWEIYVMYRTVFSERSWDSVSKLPKNAIELPEASQEWVPDVGESCLGLIPVNNIKRDFLEVSVLYYFEDEDVFAVKCKQSSGLYYCKVFKPLKNQEEKEREEFVDNAKAIVKLGMRRAVIDEVAGIMYDAGARFK